MSGKAKVLGGHSLARTLHAVSRVFLLYGSCLEVPNARDKGTDCCHL